MGNIWIGPWANFPLYTDRTLVGNFAKKLAQRYLLYITEPIGDFLTCNASTHIFGGSLQVYTADSFFHFYIINLLSIIGIKFSAFELNGNVSNYLVDLGNVFTI